MPLRIDLKALFADGNAGKDSAVMTPPAIVSSTSTASLAAWLFALACVTPALAQNDAGIAPKTDQRVPRPSGPGSVLLGNPAEPTRTADAAGAARNPGLNPPATDPRSSLPPGTNPADIKLDPKLDKLLTEWETRSQVVKQLEGSFRLYTYDEVFQTETRAQGKFWYDTPDKGRMDFDGVDLTKIAQRNAAGAPVNLAKVGPNKAPYVIKSKTSEKWVCNGSEILQIFPDKDKKEYNRIVIPKQYQGESIKDSPLPFLFGLRKAEAMERYLMSLGSMNETFMGPSKIPVYHVTALPLRDQDSREWSKADVLLDARTFLPVSIRTFDPAGTSENVYLFANVEVNKSSWLDNPFKVSVAGYRLMHEAATQPQPSGSVPPAQAPAKTGLFK